MKSRLQSYGKKVIYLLAGIFVIITIICCLPWVNAEKVGVIFGGFTGLCAACGSIMGLTIARYGARETALSIKGGYRPEMRIK